MHRAAKAIRGRTGCLRGRASRSALPGGAVRQCNLLGRSLQHGQPGSKEDDRQLPDPSGGGLSGLQAAH